MKANQNPLIGREKEIAQLKHIVDSNRSEFVVIFGRRRIGKTFLVRKFFEDRYHFSYVGQSKNALATTMTTACSCASHPG